MNSRKVAAFTRKATGKMNVLKSDVKVSAHKKLFPKATLKDFSAI